MSIRTKIDFSGITSDHIVTSDNKKYIHEDDEIFNSLNDEIAACENAQVQTEIATLQILDIKEQTKVIANEAIDSATERAESAAQNVETAQVLAETAAINALEAERNVTDFSETLARLDEDNTFSGTNNFTGTLQVGGEEVICIVESQTDGTNWYRKYSDGWIEQGGRITSFEGGKEFTFNTAFSNTNYTFVGICNNSKHKVTVLSRTNTAVTINVGINTVSSNNETTDLEWYACGY